MIADGFAQERFGVLGCQITHAGVRDRDPQPADQFGERRLRARHRRVFENEAVEQNQVGDALTRGLQLHRRRVSDQSADRPPQQVIRTVRLNSANFLDVPRREVSISSARNSESVRTGDCRP